MKVKNETGAITVFDAIGRMAIGETRTITRDKYSTLREQSTIDAISNDQLSLHTDDDQAIQKADALDILQKGGDDVLAGLDGSIPATIKEMATTTQAPIMTNDLADANIPSYGFSDAIELQTTTNAATTIKSIVLTANKVYDIDVKVRAYKDGGSKGFVENVKILVANQSIIDHDLIDRRGERGMRLIIDESGVSAVIKVKGKNETWNWKAQIEVSEVN